MSLRSSSLMIDPFIFVARLPLCPRLPALFGSTLTLSPPVPAIVHWSAPGSPLDALIIL